ncbi:MAG TPA: 3-hydroxyacyl-CoA dehydrogenase NAD-binding domain-containing protein [Pirellulaceae bacterium]|nr:3-hydroxyacyl-CoA dehydrogenase NAD-binding domain-containing protein [Pirellulaceae bacterium]
MTSALTLSRPQPDIALLSFDLPDKGANVLSRAVLAELDEHLSKLERDATVVGLILISAKSGTFIAGADLREFVASLSAPKSEVVALCRRGQELFRRLSKARFVTVAAIDGICVGGGAELASWCDRRIVSTNPRTEFGFPEVKLGLYPGWGGTVRAPRIIGLGNAVEIITSGESIDGKQAVALGLASDLVPADKLIEAAIRLIRQEQANGAYLADRQRWRQPLEVNPTELGFLGATASAMIQQETKGHYPAPAAALELMLETCGYDEQKALEKEAAGMAELFGSPINAALINIFFLTDRNKRDTGLDRSDVAPAKIQSVGVIGAGIMGSGIAAANLKQEVPVALTDASLEALTVGARNVLEEATYHKKLKGPDPQRAMSLGPLLSVARHQEELADCDLVVEAVVENVDVKKRLYAQLEPHLRPETILASNTSTIPITRLAEGLSRPDRFCGLHFFNPVRRMKLVEVIRGKQTSDQTVATAVAHAKRLGKMPVVVGDGPGFLVNRLLFPYMNEAIELLCEGASMQEIDKAAVGFGMPMGPIALYDMVGLDTAMYAGKTMWEAYPDRVVASPVLPAMVKAGRLGQKTKLGFYSYQNKRGNAQRDAAAEAIVANYRRGEAKFGREQIADRLILPMLLEATRLLEERLVRDVRDVDLGLVFGIGFPPFRGGLLFWADTLGAERIVRMLEPLARLGARMQPTPLLLEMAKSGKKFHAGK